MQDEFGFEPRAVFEAVHNWAIGSSPTVDHVTEAEVIEPEAPESAKGPSPASNQIRLTARLEAGSVSATDTVEGGYGHQQRTRSIRARFAKLEMTIERSER